MFININQGNVLKLWFDANHTESQYVEIAENSSTVIENDKEVDRTVTETLGASWNITPYVKYTHIPGDISYSFSSSDPSKLAVDENGLVTIANYSTVNYTKFRVLKHSVDITITATIEDLSIERIVHVEIDENIPHIHDDIIGAVEGTARQDMTETIDNALVGADPLTQKNIFSIQDHTNAIYTRNTSLWLNSHKEVFTCISPWNSAGGALRAGTAVTKRHIVLANHFSFAAGTTVRFVTSDNTVIERTVLDGKQIHDSVNGVDTDAYIALLDADLSSSITPCKLFPSNFETYLPSGVEENSTYAAQDIPLIAVDQEEKLLVHNFNRVTLDPYKVLYLSPSSSDWPNREAMTETIVTNDSGNPSFAVIGNEIWLTTTFHSSGVGPFYGALVNEFNAAIIELDTANGISTGYTVTEGDLSAFTAFSSTEENGGETTEDILLDLYSGAAAAYSLRSLSSSYTGDVVNVRRSSDSTEQSFTAAAVADGTLASWVNANGAADGYVSAWYDQSGNSNDIIQPYSASQPKIVDAGTLVTGGIDFRNGWLSRDDSFALTQPITAFALANTTKRTGYIMDNTDRFIIGESGTSGWGCYAGSWLTTDGTTTDSLLNTQHLSTFIANGASSSLYSNGTLLVSGNAGTKGITTNFSVGKEDSYAGYIQEIVIYSSDQSGNREVIEANIMSAYE